MKNKDKLFLNHESKINPRKLSVNDLKLDLVLNSINEGIIFFNTQGEVELINDAMLKITGYFEAEILKTSFFSETKVYKPDGSFLPLDDRPIFITLRTGEKIDDFELGYENKQGQVNWARISTRPVKDKGNILIGVIAIILDITEQKLNALKLKQSQINLANSENVLKRAQEVAHVGSWIWHIKSNSLQWSDEMFRIFGLNKEKFTGNLADVISSAIHPDDREIVDAANKKVSEEKTPTPLEYRIIHPNGSIRYVWGEAGDLILDEEGKPDMLIGIVADITERKKLGEEKLKVEKAIQQNLRLESIGILAGGIAHDFNNLLGGIFGYVELSLNELQDSQVKNHLIQVMKNMDRARALTDRLLTFSKSGIPAKEIVNVKRLINETAQFALSGSSLTCNYKISNDLLYCELDKNQISQVIENVIINAIQAMPPNGKLEIEAENFSVIEKVSFLPPGKYVKISIRDNGVGMSKEIMNHLFEPFFTTKKTGHGIGLATCHSIVKNHKGIIEVESEVGKGSSFMIYLPAATELPTMQEQIQNSNHLGKGWIVILDDEEDIRKLLSVNLESFGYNTIAKSEGKEIIRYLESTSSEITSMFLDLTIPGGLGGKEIITDIRKKYKDLPIFVLSGYSEDPIIVKPEEYGFTDSLKKPFTKNELINLLNQYLK